VGQLEAAEPKLGKLGIRADGRVHALTGLGVPFPIHGGVGERAIVLGIGTKGSPSPSRRSVHVPRPTLRSW